jgi:hypothetical protein
LAFLRRLEDGVVSFKTRTAVKTIPLEDIWVKLTMVVPKIGNYSR